MLKIGPHVSAAGGVENAPAAAASIGATAFALFTRNQRQWSPPPYAPGTAEAFADAMAAGGFDASDVLPHAGYLINLASPDDAARDRSIAALLDEARRCTMLGLDRLNIHPGSSLGKGSPEEARARVADSIDQVLAKTEGVTIVVENTAGQGSYLGASFEEIAAILEAVKARDRVGACLDTAHLHAAGHDVAGPEAWLRVLGEFDRVVGIARLRGLHLNDTRSPCGSHLDRHASIGEGRLGWETFAEIVRDPRLSHLPMILETPDDTRWPEEVRQLLRLGNGRPGSR
ncbi:MAG: deoxyribonuclease IV [Kiritimatiellia bacterium]|jgi:deoxyribonuclease-4